MYRILIAGCGYVGTRIAQHFLSKNQKVWGIIRTPERKSALEQIGIPPLVLDLTKPETFGGIPQVHFVVIAVSPDDRSEANYRKIYLEGTRNLLLHIKRNTSPLLVVYLSSTGVYCDRAGEWVDEKTPPEPDTERGKILLEAENQVLNSNLPSVVLRLAGIYGPDRNRIEKIKNGEWIPQEDRNPYMNMIHVDDIVRAIPVLFKSAEPGNVYLGADDEPVTERELYFWLCEQLKIEPKIYNEACEYPLAGKRCRNSKLKSLGASFQFPSFRDGYSTLF